MFGKLVILLCAISLAVGLAAHGSTASGPKRTYIVRPGDTLWGISGSRYGQSTRWPEIQQRNSVGEPRRLQPGTVLYFADGRLLGPDEGMVLAVTGHAWRRRSGGADEALVPGAAVRRDEVVVTPAAAFVTLLPWLTPGRPQDNNNIQPRLGFAYSLNDRTVLRGGAGRYYADVTSPNVEWSKSPEVIAILSVANDGRPDFAANPFNGPLPTFAQAEQR